MLHLYLLSLIVFALVLHLYFLEHGGDLILKKLLVSRASLYLFESLLEQHGICYNTLCASLISFELDSFAHSASLKPF